MPQSGYYRTSSKEAKARTARIKERRAVAATPEGKAAIEKRLLEKKKTKEAGMTAQEKHIAERRKIDAFMQKRAGQLAPRPSTPAAKPPPEKGVIGTVLGKRRELLEVLGKKRGKR